MFQRTDPVTMVFADDQETIRAGLTTLLGKFEQIKIPAIVSNGKELVKAVADYLPQVVITDIKMPVLNGVAATRLIKSRFPHIKVIGLSAFHDVEAVNDLRQAGASGFLLKTISPEELLEAVQAVLLDKIYYCKDILKKIGTSNTVGIALFAQRNGYV